MLQPFICEQGSKTDLNPINYKLTARAIDFKRSVGGQILITSERLPKAKQFKSITGNYVL